MEPKAAGPGGRRPSPGLRDRGASQGSRGDDRHAPRARRSPPGRGAARPDHRARRSPAPAGPAPGAARDLEPSAVPETRPRRLPRPGPALGPCVWASAGCRPQDAPRAPSQ